MAAFCGMLWHDDIPGSGYLCCMASGGCGVSGQCAGCEILSVVSDCLSTMGELCKMSIRLTNG